jgi:hypothetical protein
MDNDSFKFLTYCDFGIVSHEISPSVITEELKLTPDRFFNKGDKIVSKHSGSIVTRPYNLWAIRSKTTVLEAETVSHHIDYLKAILLPKYDVLQKFKTDPRFETTIWIWIETDDAGIGLDLNEFEIDFLSSISNRVHFTLLVKESIGSQTENH